MNKTFKNSLIVIAIVVVLFIIIWFAYDMVKTQPADANTTDTNLVDENTGLDNIINELFDNVTTNEQEENVVEDDNEENNKKNEEDNEEESKSDSEAVSSSGESVTSKEEKAVQLVKDEWGGEDGVYFFNETIDSQGRYIVSVRDKVTTDLLASFCVDVDTGLVTKQ